MNFPGLFPLLILSVQPYPMHIVGTLNFLHFGCQYIWVDMMIAAEINSLFIFVI